MLEISLHRHSMDSSSRFVSSFTMQSCMVCSVTILSLNSPPMNSMLPSRRRWALSFASSSVSFSFCFSPWTRGRGRERLR